MLGQTDSSVLYTIGDFDMTEKEIRDVFSQNLKLLREKKGLSQMALASKADLATNFINDIENGKKWISPATLSKLSEALEEMPYSFFVPVQIPAVSSNEMINQFCTEISNELLYTIKQISEKYVQ